MLLPKLTPSMSWWWSNSGKSLESGAGASKMASPVVARAFSGHDGEQVVAGVVGGVAGIPFDQDGGVMGGGCPFRRKFGHSLSYHFFASLSTTIHSLL